MAAYFYVYNSYTVFWPEISQRGNFSNYYIKELFIIKFEFIFKYFKNNNVS